MLTALSKRIKACAGIEDSNHQIIRWTRACGVTMIQIDAGSERSQPLERCHVPCKAPMARPAFDQMSIGASVRVAAHGFRKASWLLAADAAGDDGM